jgi:regulator of replication initiation timing
MPKIYVSQGEVLDKFAILEIKLNNIKDDAKIANVREEYERLIPFVDQLYKKYSGIPDLFLQLFEVNNKLWVTEDKLRQYEKEKVFDDEFVKLARNVYTLNDERSALKKRVNTLTNSSIIEEKSY